MIITLKGANFKDSNIGTLSTWTISRVLGDGATYNGVTYVDKNAALNATVTIDEEYELGAAGVTVTMGGNAVTSGITVDGNTITIAIASVTGNVVIKVPTKNTATGEEGGGDEEPEIPINPPSGDETTSGTLFLQNGALSVVKGENFFVSMNSTTSKECRMNSSSLTEGTGIWVPADATITLTGTSGLRFDYVYATKNAANSSTDKKSNLIGGVGTASNWVSSNYFPYNEDGSSNTISITNNYGQGYYYYFAISGPKKTEKLNPADYTITYVVVEAEVPVPGEVIDSGTLTLHQGALSVVSGEAGQISNNNTKRMTSASTSTANGILVPTNKSVTLTGLAPSGKNAVRFDCVWASSAGPNPAYSGTTGGVWSPIIAIDSNYVAANYFPHNTSGANTCTVTNNQSSDCYVFFAFSGLTKNEVIPTTDYTITYTVQ